MGDDPLRVGAGSRFGEAIVMRRPQGDVDAVPASGTLDREERGTSASPGWGEARGPGAVKSRSLEGNELHTDIRTAVCQELASDPHVAADDSVVEVSNGDVSLNGTVPSQVQHTEAVAAVQRIGV
jgi:hypothetical protein